MIKAIVSFVENLNNFFNLQNKKSGSSLKDELGNANETLILIDGDKKTEIKYNGQSPLHLAVIAGDVASVKRIVAEYKANNNYTQLNCDGEPSSLSGKYDEDKQTALKLAYKLNYSEITQFLINGEACNKDPVQILYGNVCQGIKMYNDYSNSLTYDENELTATNFYQRYIQDNFKQLPQNNKNSILHRLTGYKYYSTLLLIKPMVEDGAEVTSVNQNGDSLIHSMLNINSFLEKDDILKYLLSSGIDINLKNTKGQTPLHSAIESNLLTTGSKDIKLLIRNNADINIQDENGNTPLLLSVMYGAKNISENLLNEGADASIANNKGETALKILCDQYTEAEKIHTYESLEDARKLVLKIAEKTSEDISEFGGIVDDLDYLILERNPVQIKSANISDNNSVRTIESFSYDYKDNPVDREVAENAFAFDQQQTKEFGENYWMFAENIPKESDFQWTKEMVEAIID